MGAYTLWVQENPRAHDRAPYAVRMAGGRPTGSYATVGEAAASGVPGGFVVTVDGWWIVARIEAS